MTRIMQALITLFTISIIIFALTRLSGNQLDVLLPEWAPPTMRAELAERMGLDKSYPEQYIRYMGSVFRGEFGLSGQALLPVGPIFFSALGNSVKLILAAFPIAVLLCIPLAMIAATQVGTFQSKLVMGLAVFGQSAPTFFVGLMLIWVLAVQWRILPAAMMGGPAHYVLPSITLGIYVLSSETRILRNSLMRVLSDEFIKLVRLKGAAERLVLWKHALRNAIIAMLTNAAQSFARLLVGSLVVETIFAWPGAGRLLSSAITSRDYAVVQTAVLVICAVMVLMSLVVDIIYAYIDPRIRVF